MTHELTADTADDPVGTAKIQVASTFFNRETAENALADLLESSAVDVQQWLAGTGGQLTLLGRSDEPVGLVLTAPAVDPVAGCGYKVVLRRTTAVATGYYVLTVMVMP